MWLLLCQVSNLCASLGTMGSFLTSSTLLLEDAEISNSPTLTLFILNSNKVVHELPCHPILKLFINETKDPQRGPQFFQYNPGNHKATHKISSNMMM